MSYISRLQSIIQNKLAPRATGTSVAAGGVAISTTCGVFTTASASFVDVPNLSITLVSTGRPIFVGLIPDGTVNPSVLFVTGTTTNSIMRCNIVRDSTTVGIVEVGSIQSTTTNEIEVPAGALYSLDPVSSGTYTYKVQVLLNSGSFAFVLNCKLIAYEI